MPQSYHAFDRSRFEPANNVRTPERRRWWAHFSLIVRRSDVEPIAMWLALPSLLIGLVWLLMPSQPFAVRCNGSLSAAMGMLGIMALCLWGSRRRYLLGLFGAIGFALRVQTVANYISTYDGKLLHDPILFAGAVWTTAAAVMFAWLLIRAVCGEAYRAGLRKGNHLKLVTDKT